jgi:probable rRNA maturation factor
MQIDVQFAVETNDLPGAGQLRSWAQSAMLSAAAGAEVTIRVVDEAESAELNTTYRHKTGATNVLSFCYDAPVADIAVLGDLVICAPVVAREAAQQHKSIEAHWAHMVVHGMLHLQGYDHENEQDAQRMEAEEIRILSGLGYDNPYQVTQ